MNRITEENQYPNLSYHHNSIHTSTSIKCHDSQHLKYKYKPYHHRNNIDTNISMNCHNSQHLKCLYESYSHKY